MTKSRSFRVSVLAVAAMLVFATGCGGADSSAPAAAPEMSSSETSGSEAYTAKRASYDADASGDSLQTVYTDRQMIQRGAMTLRVNDANQASKRAQALTESAGGFVEASSIENVTGRKPVAQMTLRVPAPKLTTLLDQLESLGTRIQRSVTREDVTTELVDIDARLRNLRAQEDALREIFRRAGKISDVMEVQRRLADVRSEIERLDAHRAQMRELVALSTIELTLDESAAGLAGEGDPGWFKEGLASATQAFAGFLRQLALVGVWLAVFSPIWLPFALLVGWLRVRRSRRARSREVMGEPPA